ncbi:MAG: hypothetical protein A3B82_06410 [Methylophilales bacterium RIFCSPHIGHO2_02_FULL_57_10]|nr:MAG: hypothetical protein A3B82_06410 [Methylophilales bacterium RIFCSPHIGHO2_02_FULL_57_10]
MDFQVNRQSDLSAVAGESQPKTAGRICLNSVNLFKGEREIIIKHAGDEYRLRITSQGKLILTK